MQGLLWDVEPTDPWASAAVTVLTLGIGLLARFFLARRATKIDPLKALRFV